MPSDRPRVAQRAKLEFQLRSNGAIVVLVAPAPLSEWPLERSRGLVQSFSSSFSSSEELAQLRQELDLRLVARWRLMSRSKMLVRLTQQPSPQAKIIFGEK
jgi:hypothetical protein